MKKFKIIQRKFQKRTWVKKFASNLRWQKMIGLPYYHPINSSSPNTSVLVPNQKSPISHWSNRRSRNFWNLILELAFHITLQEKTVLEKKASSKLQWVRCGTHFRINSSRKLLKLLHFLTFLKCRNFHLVKSNVLYRKHLIKRDQNILNGYAGLRRLKAKMKKKKKHQSKDKNSCLILIAFVQQTSLNHRYLIESPYPSCKVSRNNAS